MTPGVVASLEASRRAVVGALRDWSRARRIVAVEHPHAGGTDLAGAFAGARVRRHELGRAPEWRGWPDLLWLGFALSPFAVDAERFLSAVWDALPDGAVVAAVDLAPGWDGVADVPLLDEWGLDASRDTLGLLRTRFATVAACAPPAASGPTYGFVGVKVADRDW